MKDLIYYQLKSAIDRRTYIGSSDAKALMAGELYNLWLEKTRRADPVSLEWKFNAQLGKASQHVNLRFYAHTNNMVYGSPNKLIAAGGAPLVIDFEQSFPDTLLLHPIYSNVACTPDGLVTKITEEGEIDYDWPFYGVDAKHTGAHMEPRDLVDYNYWQCQWFMFVTGASRWVLSPIYGNELGEPLTLERDNDRIGEMNERLQVLLKCIETDTPPPRGDTPETRVARTPSVAATEYGKWRVLELTESDNLAPELADLLDGYDEAKDQADQFNERKEKIKAIVPADVRLVYFKDPDTPVSGYAIERTKAGSLTVKDRTDKLIRKHRGIA